MAPREVADNNPKKTSNKRYVQDSMAPLGAGLGVGKHDFGIFFEIPGSARENKSHKRTIYHAS